MTATRSEARIQTASLLILAVLAVGAALYWLRPVMIPFVLAVFVALGLAPLVELQMRWFRFPRWVAVLGTLGLSVLLFGGVGALVSASVGQLVGNAETYQAQAALLMERVETWLPLEALGVDAERVTGPLGSLPVDAVGSVLVGTGNALLDLLSQSLVVGIFVVYLLIGSAGREEERRGTRAEIEERIQRFLVTKAVISAATGVFVGVTLALLGIDLALVFGLMAFLLNFVPSVGSVIATLLPLPIVLMNPDVSALTAVLALAIPGVVQFAIGNVIEPKVMGESLDLHPVVILLSLIFWGMLWGIVGMLLATPITAVLKIVCEKFEYTRGVAQILAGRIESRSADPAREYRSS
ncbi:MAG: AI-2E family transporter [Proteobacteria bacterium]|nr:AI-2E family transporter [Pseudomonadota bacterium]